MRLGSLSEPPAQLSWASCSPVQVQGERQGRKHFWVPSLPYIHTWEYQISLAWGAAGRTATSPSTEHTMASIPSLIWKG